MKQRNLVIQSNRPLTDSVYELKLSGVEGEVILPGQFVNLNLEGHVLRRPISVCDVQSDILTLVYRAVGSGTNALSHYKEGGVLDTLIGLGNGYDLSKAGDAPLLVGGGDGIPPLYYLAKTLRRTHDNVTVILGFNTASECFYEEEFNALGVTVIVTTADGSYGIPGFVTDALPEHCSYYYACGPLPMEKALYRSLASSGEFSLEERMGCGFGACMGCSIPTASGTRRICKEGPVFAKEELLWDD